MTTLTDERLELYRRWCRDGRRLIPIEPLQQLLSAYDAQVEKLDKYITNGTEAVAMMTGKLKQLKDHNESLHARIAKLERVREVAQKFDGWPFMQELEAALAAVEEKKDAARSV